MRHLRAIKPRHLQAVPAPATIVGFGVVGKEQEGRRAYYAAFGPFSSSLEALCYRGAAKDLHTYSAYEEYFAVAIYGNGELRELFYTQDLESCGVAPRTLQELHRGMSFTLFSELLAAEA